MLVLLQTSEHYPSTLFRLENRSWMQRDANPEGQNVHQDSHVMPEADSRLQVSVPVFVSAQTYGSMDIWRRQASLDTGRTI